MPGGTSDVSGRGPPSVRPLRSGAVTGGESRRASGAFRVGGTVGSGLGRAANCGRLGADGFVTSRRSALGAWRSVPGSRLSGGLAASSLLTEGSLEKRRVAGGSTAFGPTGGAGIGPGPEDAAGGSRMRTRSGASEKTGALVPRKAREAKRAPCKRSESPRVLPSMELPVTRSRPHSIWRIIGKHLSPNKEICRRMPARRDPPRARAPACTILASPTCL